jgi:hypothetical protein
MVNSSKTPAVPGLSFALCASAGTEPGRQVRRWSVGLFIGAQYLAGLRLDHMDLQAKAGDALIRFVAIHGPIAHEPACTQWPVLGQRNRRVAMF